MSVVAFTAGSLGDILAVSQILLTIICTLSGTCSPSDAETSLLRSLNSLHFTLGAAQNILQTFDSSAGQGVFEVRYGIQAELASCHCLLRDFELMLLHTRRSLHKTTISTLWTAVAWAWRGDAQVEEFRRAVSRHETRLSELFGMLNTSYAQTTSREIRKLAGRVETPSARIQVKTLYITNPTGKIFGITIDHVFSVEQLHDLIVGYMKNSCGYDYVLQRQYTLVDKDDNEINVKPREIQHGTMLEMSMMEFKKSIIPFVPFGQYECRCPSCEHSISAESGQWVTCDFCSIRFRCSFIDYHNAAPFHSDISSHSDTRHFRRLHRDLSLIGLHQEPKYPNRATATWMMKQRIPNPGDMAQTPFKYCC